MYKSLAVIVCLFLLISCKNESGSSELSPEINTLLEDLNNQPSAAKANAVIRAFSKELSEMNDQTKKKTYLEQGYKIATDHKMSSASMGFLMPLIRNYPDDPTTSERLFTMGKKLQLAAKNEAANVIFSGFADRFPNDPQVADAKAAVKPAIENIDTFITNVAANVFINPDQFGINRRSAQTYVDVCEAYALSYNSSPNAPVYLYKAAEMARTLRTFTKSLTIYDWIADEYPNYEKTPTTLFLKGFIVENELNNPDLAKSTYETFLDKYPNHDLADDVKFLLENIGKSDEEIMQMIERRKQENNKNQ